MARSRNIKPGFFLNEELVELPYEARLLFIGLWCIADREGRLANRPKKIKMQLFPADDLDISKALLGLAEYGFLQMYRVDSIEYIQIVNFNKHQNPHHKEADSAIPAPDLPSASPSKAVLIPDSLNPESRTPDSLNPEPDPRSLKPEKTLVELKPDDAKEIFEYWQKVMNHPRAAFDNKRKTLIKKCFKHYSVDDLKKAIKGCSITPHNMGENKEGRVYDSIELILRDAKHIDDYMRNADKPPASGVTTIQQTQDRAQQQAERIKKQLGWNQ